VSSPGAASRSTGPRRRARDVAAAACLAAAIVALLPTVLAGYAERALFDSEQFANRATAAVRDPDVRSRVATEVTDGLVLANASDLVTARPIIEGVVSNVVGSAAFLQLFHASALDVHRAVFRRDADTVTLTLADVGTVVAAALEVVRPSLARQLDEDSRVTLLRRHVDERATTLARLAERIDLLAVLLGALVLVLATAAVALAADRRRAVARLGTGAAVVGVVIVVSWVVARAIALEQVSDENRDVARAVWDAFLGDLRTAGWVLAGAGAVLAAAAASLLRPVALEPALRRLRDRVVTEPQRPVLRVLRALGLITVGALVVARPAEILSLIATLAGVCLIYAGVVALLRLIDRPEEAAAARARPRIGRRLAVAGIAGVLIAAACTLFVVGGGASEAAPAVAGCNGHAELCDKPLNRVVLPATHNSMSAPLPGWFSSQQDAPIEDQLADGIRGLMIDTHYADLLANGRVRTDITGGGPQKLASQDGVSDESLDAALRLRDRLGFRGEGERGIYLCHSFCELGATPLSDGLDAIHDFLVTHPGEVLVVINQDYVTPSDFVAAVDRAGVTDLIYTPPSSGDWATLGELVRDDRRVVFLAENEAGEAPWYRLAYDGLTEETPYSFGSVDQLVDPDELAASCRDNRGQDGSPLFLVNHWITSDPIPRPSNAAQVNAREPLLRRARDCARIRDHMPNLLAVDFYRHGDLFDVVDTLNGVS
jgi:hypothetical protein